MESQQKEEAAAAAVATDDDDDDEWCGEQGLSSPLGLKMRRKLGERRGGTHTPLPLWTTLDQQQQQQRSSSARKLGAGLWEAHSLLPQQAASMSRRSTGLLPLPSSPQLLPKYAVSSRRHAAASFSGHPNMIGRSTGDLLPISPKSYCSSMEAVTPDSSLDLDKRLGESGYSLKTSAESLKVLNRIWVLEKQQVSNISLVKALKSELNRAQLHIQELIQEREVYHREMDTLMKRVSEDRIIRKKKEENRTKAALQSIRNELEDERKMRRRSEGLHRKLGKELSDMGSKLKKALNDLEKESKARKLVEDLCDEFAKGVGDYDREVIDLMQIHEKGADHRFHQFAVHISETWLNERFKIKAAEARGDEVEKNTISERLTGEIMAFLEERNSSAHDGANRRKDFSVRRHSVESLHINGAGSAPQDAEDNDSISSDLHCFELKMDANDSENPGNFKLRSKGGRERSGETKDNLVKYSESSSKVQFEEHADRTDLHMGKKQQLVDRLRRISLLADAEGFEVHTGTSHRDSCNNFSLGQHNEVNPAGDRNKQSSQVLWRNYGHASSGLETSECSSKLPQNMKDNSLKERLLEARLEGQQVRMKASQGYSFGGRLQQMERQ